ncbi:DJ-1/PfpI family protein [Vallitalea okinawensis]|uniref:DJ-1/PfpI family protein n=1 Tax=Vallitalea okinawensis TaxID=2078660 RepID=UPI000CFC453D|nr:DJ-1/PfpI family protein [Vallitalea okinawensis]
MNTYILIYEGFANFEVVIASLLLKSKGDIITIAVDDNPITSCEGFKYVPHKLVKDIDINDVGVLLIPGGDPNELYDKKEVYDLVRRANNEKAIIGAICAGPVHLAKAGIIQDVKYTVSKDERSLKYFNKDNYEGSNVVVDGNIVTAKPTGYVDFGIELGKLISIYDNEEDLKGTINFFKYFKE